MEIDSRFPTKLDSVSDAPEPLRSVVEEGLASPKSVRLLVHAPAFSTVNEKSPATVLAVTDSGWLVASETDEGGASLEKANFSDTLFLELTSILLSGRLRICFGTVGAAYSADITFDTVGEEVYREAIDLMLNGIDQTVTPPAENDGDANSATSISEAWPLKFRAEAERYRPKGQRFLAATQWSAIFGGFQRELAPAGALLLTARELVLISEEKASPRQHIGDLHEFGGIITYFPLVRLADYHLSHHERFGVLALQVHATHGGEKLEIIFPSDHERAVSEVMDRRVLRKG